MHDQALMLGAEILKGPRQQGVESAQEWGGHTCQKLAAAEALLHACE